MNTLYLQCNMGIAGDMLCGALLDLMSDEQKQSTIDKINTFVDNAKVSANTVSKSGIVGTKFDVDIALTGTHHTNIEQIYAIIDGFDVDDKTKADAKAVYSIIANAESKVHNTDVADVHLHEVGAVDAIIDITSACYMINMLHIEQVVASTVTTGYGEVKCAHGVMPVPAPATAIILSGISCVGGNTYGELCTPTGAALVKYFANEISDNNDMPYTKIGYGMGTKEFEKPNCVRAFFGSNNTQIVYELRCQIDDMTGEEMGYAINKMLKLGAKDAFVQNIVMKKSRPAYAFTVICTPDKADYLTTQIFKHTTTLGVRRVKCVRYELEREFVEKDAVHIKRASGYGTDKSKIEFDDLAKFADEKDISLFEAKKIINNY